MEAAQRRVQSPHCRRRTAAAESAPARARSGWSAYCLDRRLRALVRPWSWRRKRTSRPTGRCWRTLLVQKTKKGKSAEPNGNSALLFLSLSPLSLARSCCLSQVAAAAAAALVYIRRAEHRASSADGAAARSSSELQRAARSSKQQPEQRVVGRLWRRAVWAGRTNGLRLRQDCRSAEPQNGKSAADADAAEEVRTLRQFAADGVPATGTASAGWSGCARCSCRSECWMLPSAAEGCRVLREVAEWCWMLRRMLQACGQLQPDAARCWQMPADAAE